MTSSIIVIFVTVIIVLLLIITKLWTTPGRMQLHNNTERKHSQAPKICILCSSAMPPNAKIHSTYYRTLKEKCKEKHAVSIEEILTHVFGCPLCWPANLEHNRVCPVCRKSLASNGFLVARTFRKKGKKDHVHILGCTECKIVR